MATPRRAQSLVELMVAIAVGAVLFIGAGSLIAPVFRINKSINQIEAGAALAKELMDNVRVYSEGDWHNMLNLATGTTHAYYLITASSPFVATSGQESVMVSTTTFTRYFYVSDVYRDSSGYATSTAAGNSYDPSTKQITVVYGWPRGVTTTFSSYLTRNRTVVMNQSDWSGGGGASGPITSTNNLFGSSSNINFSTPGVIYATVSSSVAQCTGALGAWSSGTALPGPVSDLGAAAYNGYLYTLGGQNIDGVTSSVNFAPINSTGSLGSWQATTALPHPIAQLTSVAYNGFLYSIGGYATSSVYYASINGSGTLGSWQTATALPGILYDATALVYNGYIYIVGGGVGPLNEVSSTVLTTSIAGNGTLGSWQTATALPSSLSAYVAGVYNGYIYVAGGQDSSVTATSTALSDSITGNGTLGSWQTTTALPSPLSFAAGAASGGYLYSLAGGNSAGTTSTVFYASVSNGTIGSWRTTSALPTSSQELAAVIYNNYVYALGGYGSDFFSTVSYASCRG